MRYGSSSVLSDRGLARRSFLRAMTGLGPAALGDSPKLYSQQTGQGVARKSGAEEAGNSDSAFARSLRQAAVKVPIFDTHEHLWHENVRLKTKIDAFILFSDYTNADLISAGMSPEAVANLQDTQIPLEKRWNELSTFWPYTRSTGYGRWILTAAQDLFGIEDINERTYHELSERIASSNQPGWYEYVLKQKAGITTCMLDDLTTRFGEPLKPDPRFFRIITRFDYIIMAGSRTDLSRIENATGVSIHDLADYEKALQKAINKAMGEGLAGIKCALAYERSLEFERVSEPDARRAFNNVFGTTGSKTTHLAAEKHLQDYMMYKLTEQASEHGLTLQVHTGMQDGNRNHIAWSRPSHLSTLIQDFPRAKFDLFHGGYPYCGELSTLAKNEPNVYANLCWLHIISPAVAKWALHQLIETVPGNKILGFGGDSQQVEGAYAAARMARRVTAEVLVEKVEQGYLNEEEATLLLARILHENGAALFARGTPDRVQVKAFVEPNRDPQPLAVDTAVERRPSGCATVS